MPQPELPPGASDLLVPGAKPTIVKSKGAFCATVPGTRNTTASMVSLDLLKAVPVPSQHFVLKLVNGMKLGPDGSVMVAHQRWFMLVAPSVLWTWIRKDVGGAVLRLQFTAMP